MGALRVLALQLLLLACSLGAEGFPEWSVASDTERTEELSSKEVPPYFETGYGELHQAEVPELGLDMRYQAPQDYDITVMKHRVRRSDKKKKKKIKNRTGAFSPLGNSRTKREEEAKTKKRLPKRRKPHPGQMSALGSTGEDKAPAENQGPE